MKKSKYVSFPIMIIFFIYFIMTYVLIYKYCTGHTTNNPWIFQSGLNDYWAHLFFTSFNDIITSTANVECMWHVLVWAFTNVLRINQPYAAAIVTAMFNTVTIILINYYLKNLIKDNDQKNKYIADIFTVILSFVGPLSLPFYSSSYYLGQFNFNIYHSPTYIAVKPFAVLILILMKKIFDEYESTKKVKLKLLVSISVVMMLSILAKPALIQVLFPGFFIYFVLDLLFTKKENSHFNLGVKLFLTCIPALILIVIEYLVLFTGETGNSISFKPFVVWNFFSKNIIISFIVSFAFPVFVLVNNIKKLNSIDKFSIAVFIAGLLEFSLLAEVGDRMLHGNLGWGLLLGNMMLWISAVVQFINNIKENNIFSSTAVLNKRKSIIINIGFLLLFAHFFFGLIFYFCS